MRIHLSFFLLLLASFSLSTCAVDDAEPDPEQTVEIPADHLVAHYPLDGSLLDESGNDLHGDVYGDVSFSMNRHGIAGKAIEIGQSFGFGVVEDNELLDFGRLDGAGWSISVWYNSFGENAQYVNWIVGKGITQESKSTDYGIAIHNNADVLGGSKFVTVGGPSTDECVFQNHNLPEEEGWHHVVLVFENQAEGAGAKHFYLDGTLVSSCMYIDKGQARNEDLLIGAGLTPSRAVERFFYGQIDDVYIYNRALTKEEVVALYNE